MALASRTPLMPSEPGAMRGVPSRMLAAKFCSTLAPRPLAREAQGEGLGRPAAVLNAKAPAQDLLTSALGWATCCVEDVPATRRGTHVDAKRQRIDRLAEFDFGSRC
jgi:hypothetical protein